jgi:uncharacterized protein (TIGR02284 family)
MNSIDAHVINVLTDLVEVCRNGQRGFETAAEHTEAGGGPELFQGYAAERQEYIRELQAQIFALGGETEKSGSMGGSLHRGWMNLRSAMTSKEAAALLGECERGEDAAVKAYREALKTELDPETRTIVSRQARGVEAVHDRVKQLRDSVAHQHHGE